MYTHIKREREIGLISSRSSHAARALLRADVRAPVRSALGIWAWYLRVNTTCLTNVFFSNSNSTNEHNNSKYTHNTSNEYIYIYIHTHIHIHIYINIYIHVYIQKLSIV